MPKQGDYVVVRSRDNGCHCGEYVTHSGREVVLTAARHVRSWQGERLSIHDVAVVVGPCELGRESHGERLIMDACGIDICTPEVEKSLREMPAKF